MHKKRSPCDGAQTHLDLLVAIRINNSLCGQAKTVRAETSSRAHCLRWPSVAAIAACGDERLVGEVGGVELNNDKAVGQESVATFVPAGQEAGHKAATTAT